MPITLQDLAEKLEAKLVLDRLSSATSMIHSLATLTEAGDGQISFLANSKYSHQLEKSNAQVVLVSEQHLASCPRSALIMDNPYLGFALTAQIFDTTPNMASGIAESAVIADDAQLGKDVKIGANAVIESGAILADGVQIGAGCFIGKNAVIGAGTRLWANVTLYHNVVVGEACLFQSGAVIGSDGFGYANHAGNWIKIPQLGSVIIGDRVEVGASTTIDRGVLNDTEIADGVILDNQIQIAHNVTVGENTAIAACSVIAGSSSIGKNCSVAGLVGINGHIDICDGVVFTGMTMVTNNIKEPGIYSSGIPATPNRVWRKNAVVMRNIHGLAERVKKLEKNS
jgi:UDP-3-O-[3-hydroxymyristoyl] glucosamine N-acyltransferase